MVRKKSTRQAIKDLGQSIQQQIADLRVKIMQVKEHKSFLEDSPIPKAELIERVHDWIDTRSSELDVGYGLSHLRAPKPDRRYSNVSLFDVGISGQSGNGYTVTADLAPLMCALFGDQLKERLAVLLKEAPYPDPGPESSERTALIADVDKELDRIEFQEESLVMQAAEIGLTILRRDDCRPEIILSLKILEAS